MKVVVLKGHGRGITQLKFNREGDLLFSVSKSKEINLWRASDGERLGTYHGHNGAVYAVDINRKSTRMITAGADNKAKVWDIEEGVELYSINLQTPGRAIEFAQGDKKFMVATDSVMGFFANILIFPFSEETSGLSNAPLATISLSPSRVKVLDLAWGPLNKNIFASTDNGKVLVYDSESLEKVHEICDNARDSEVKRLTTSKDRMCILTACTDKTARLYDTRTFKQIKLYETGRPCNSADIYPTPELDHILLAGGQGADQVTTTRVDPAQFASRVHHKIFQEELATIPGHFGPVNDVRYNPNGRSFATGGEDGYVRLNILDDEYFKGLNNEVYFAKLNNRVALR
uniref:Serine-threonine kinase receptor-associated protein n=1 Tax=Paramoeba aestuarina TaxID=180227 RepID=A0A7S4U866_9EUKA|mmetsp:Transcript_7558/g.11379  ORF Transcript_7558/g.11379 Transcript_7558/m.11379 type:complete len:345 (+) Transcript_7558:64-1098(+)|eukprot:CAMPEP_0201522314 /NCGR_PEP_ID=MMETSP0161_2-20130828/16911_1 /ASSEMBLY_ACC=CAM_ASM_000251 /TAXON_ID=180227 /ORGANISM="Neoparamoeba aestuarina, Strain SoJaBio B1-5/56/2" /LENGTH=344 /DNA_ID=CAMNT_0047921125 /DNA_START=118 /DNA_END=1152 /DNA_ORIENTATION=+